MKSQESPKKIKTARINRRKKYGGMTKLFIGKERAYLFDDLSMMMKSGITVQSGLSLIRRNTKQKLLRKIISQILASVEEGHPLWQSMEETDIFSDYSISLVRVGEEAGKLTDNLELIAQHEEKQSTLNSKIKTAISYPIFVFSLTLIIAIGAVWFIFPKLSTVFRSLNVELPTITRILISIGDIMRDHGLLVVSAVLIFVVLIVGFLFILKPTRKFGDMLLLRLPIISNLIKQIEIERFGFLLGTLLDAGLPINASLRSLSQATRIHSYKKIYETLSIDIENGISLENSFRKIRRINRFIPQPVIEMIATGERSGRLPVVLQEIAARYSKKTELSTDNLTQMLEPFLLVFVWLGVLCIALAVIVPIYGIAGNLNSPVTTNPSNSVIKPASINKIEITVSEGEYAKAYSLPDKSSEVVENVKIGEQFNVIEVQSDWIKIPLTDNRVAWVAVINTKVRYE